MKIGMVEKTIYRLRKQHPLVIPQIDPDKNNLEKAKSWFKDVRDAGLEVIVIGGSTINILDMQKLLDIAVNDFDFQVLTYLSGNVASLNGISNKTAMYWMQVPNALNTFYSWDGLVTNSLYVERNKWEVIPTAYVFDDRGYKGTSSWITRSNLIPESKPELSLAVAKAAEFLGIRFYIMAGGSGSPKPPPVSHISTLIKNSDLFVIPTSGITDVTQVSRIFEAGADAIHVGNRLERKDRKEILKEMVKLSEKFSGRAFI